jgi:hypothetical protein
MSAVVRPTEEDIGRYATGAASFQRGEAAGLMYGSLPASLSNATMLFMSMRAFAYFSPDKALALLIPEVGHRLAKKRVHRWQREEKRRLVRRAGRHDWWNVP